MNALVESERLQVQGTITPKSHAIAIIGGGFSGTCCAIHLLRLPDVVLEIVLIEPRGRLGGGLAHSCGDPDHRINAPASIHIVLPDQPGHLDAWLRSEGRVERDPDCEAPGGGLYPRRSDFGDYVRAQLLEAARSSPSSFRHLRTQAVAVERGGGQFHIVLQSGARIEADCCIVATGHEPPSPPAFVGSVMDHPRYFDDPWDLERLRAIDPRSSVLLIGTGLTAADIVATLMRRGHQGLITALSRHGYTPAIQSPAAVSKSLWEAINDPMPEFIARHGRVQHVSEIMRLLRRDIEEELQAGRTWHGAFDQVRNAARQLWGPLPREEKRRFLRHLRSIYDPHRFRFPPQTARIFQAAITGRQLSIVAGRIRSVVDSAKGFDVEYRPRGERRLRRGRFDAIVNCTGPEVRPGRSRNPVIRSLSENGLAREDDAGIGLETDVCCRAVPPAGGIVPGLYFLGPLTRGQIGETPAVPLITLQVLNLIPGLIAGLRSAAGGSRT